MAEIHSEFCAVGVNFCGLGVVAYSSIVTYPATTPTDILLVEGLKKYENVGGGV